jgi:hypothetical protein
MSVQVNNTDNQLSIITNGVLDVYAVKTIKSVSRGVDVSGNSYIIINFIANDKNNSLRINLSEVTSPVTWTNDAAGAATAVSDIRGWLTEIIEVEISEANDSILVYGFDGVNNQPIAVDTNGELQVDVLSLPNPGYVRVTGALRPTDTSGDVNTVADTFFSVSVANVGALDGTILAGVTIKPGEVLSFSADALNNYFTSFAYNATGTEFLIIYVTE